MQQTRQLILEILREQGECTVDQLVESIQTRIQHRITAVTVRHHIDVLRGEGLITSPNIKRSGAPGRPQYTYMLTEKAQETFPNNYQDLMNKMLDQMKNRLGNSQVNVIFDDVADQMIAEMDIPPATLHKIPMPDRLNHVIRYLNERGYEASWHSHPEGYVLNTSNCPYKKVSHEHEELCGMDMRLISGLLGVVPRSLGRIVDAQETCSYLLPSK
jgi:predicted ArsR family transcriptional regulator